MAAREVFELIINADGSSAQNTFSNLAGNVKKEFGDLETKSGGFINNIVSKSPTASAALDKIGVSGQQAGSLIEKAIPLAAVAGGAAIGAFAVKAVADYQNLAQSVLKYQQIAGGTAEEASRWVQTADDFGVSVESLSSSMGKFEKTVGSTPQALEKFGVTIARTTSGAVDLQGTFFNVIDAYNSTDDATQKASIAQAAFGKQWQGLVKLLDAGADNIREDFKSINSQQILHQGDLKASEDFRVALDNLGDAVQGLEIELVRGVVPALASAASGFAKMIKTVDDAGTSVQNFGDKNRDMLGPIGHFFGILTGGTIVADNNKKKTEELSQAHEQLKQVTSRTTQSQGDWKATLEATTKPAEAAKALVDAYNQTLKSIDSQSQVATKAHQTHVDALNALADAFGLDTAVMISNMGLSDLAMKNMSADASDLFKAMESSFNGSTDVVSHFADESTVRSQDVIKWMRDQVTQAHTWADGLKTLAADGIDNGILLKLEEAGPKSAALVTALLNAVKHGDLDAINAMQADLNTTLTTAETEAVNHQPSFAAAGTSLGAAMKDGTTTALDTLGGAVGSITGSAADIARNNALPEWIAAGTSLGAAFIAGAQRSIANYHPATTPNLGGGKDIRVSDRDAVGGVLHPGNLTLVGEKGPELIVPGIQPRTVIPNNVLRGGLGGGNTTVNIYGNQYGVEDVQGAIYDALDNVRRRAMAGAR
jgi:hypothetical protein